MNLSSSSTVQSYGQFGQEDPGEYWVWYTPTGQPSGQLSSPQPVTSSYPAGYIAVSSSGAQFPSVIQAAPARSTVVNYADQAVIAPNAAASYSWSQLSTVGFSQSTNLASVIMDSAPAAVHLVSNDSTQLCNQGVQIMNQLGVDQLSFASEQQIDQIYQNYYVNKNPSDVNGLNSNSNTAFGKGNNLASNSYEFKSSEHMPINNSVPIYNISDTCTNSPQTSSDEIYFSEPIYYNYVDGNVLPVQSAGYSYQYNDTKSVQQSRIGEHFRYVDLSRQPANSSWDKQTEYVTTQKAPRQMQVQQQSLANSTPSSRTGLKPASTIMSGSSYQEPQSKGHTSSLRQSESHKTVRFDVNSRRNSSRRMLKTIDISQLYPSAANHPTKSSDNAFRKTSTSSELKRQSSLTNPCAQATTGNVLSSRPQHGTRGSSSSFTTGSGNFSPATIASAAAVQLSSRSTVKPTTASSVKQLGPASPPIQANPKRKIVPGGGGGRVNRRLVPAPTPNTPQILVKHGGQLYRLATGSNNLVKAETPAQTRTRPLQQRRDQRQQRVQQQQLARTIKGRNRAEAIKANVQPKAGTISSETQTHWSLDVNGSYFFMKNSDSTLAYLDQSFVEMLRSDPQVNFYKEVKTNENSCQTQQFNPLLNMTSLMGFEASEAETNLIENRAYQPQSNEEEQKSDSMEEVKTEIGQMKSAADSTHYQLIGEYRQKGANAVESDGSNQVLMATKASASSSAKTFTICEVEDEIELEYLKEYRPHRQTAKNNVAIGNVIQKARSAVAQQRRTRATGTVRSADQVERRSSKVCASGFYQLPKISVLPGHRNDVERVARNLFGKSAPEEPGSNTQADIDPESSGLDSTARERKRKKDQNSVVRVNKRVRKSEIDTNGEDNSTEGTITAQLVRPGTSLMEALEIVRQRSKEKDDWRAREIEDLKLFRFSEPDPGGFKRKSSRISLSWKNSNLGRKLSGIYKKVCKSKAASNFRGDDNLSAYYTDASSFMDLTQVGELLGRAEMKGSAEFLAHFKSLAQDCADKFGPDHNLTKDADHLLLLVNLLDRKWDDQFKPKQVASNHTQGVDVSLALVPDNTKINNDDVANDKGGNEPKDNINGEGRDNDELSMSKLLEKKLQEWKAENQEVGEGWALNRRCSRSKRELFPTADAIPLEELEAPAKSKRSTKSAWSCELMSNDTDEVEELSSSSLDKGVRIILTKKTSRTKRQKRKLSKTSDNKTTTRSSWNDAASKDNNNKLCDTSTDQDNDCHAKETAARPSASNRRMKIGAKGVKTTNLDSGDSKADTALIKMQDEDHRRPTTRNRRGKHEHVKQEHTFVTDNKRVKPDSSSSRGKSPRTIPQKSVNNDISVKDDTIVESRKLRSRSIELLPAADKSAEKRNMDIQNSKNDPAIDEKDETDKPKRTAANKKTGSMSTCKGVNKAKKKAKSDNVKISYHGVDLRSSTTRSNKTRQKNHKESDDEIADKGDNKHFDDESTNKQLIVANSVPTKEREGQGIGKSSASLAGRLIAVSTEEDDEGSSTEAWDSPHARIPVNVIGQSCSEGKPMDNPGEQHVIPFSINKVKISDSFLTNKSLSGLSPFKKTGAVAFGVVEESNVGNKTDLNQDEEDAGQSVDAAETVVARDSGGV